MIPIGLGVAAGGAIAWAQATKKQDVTVTGPGGSALVSRSTVNEGQKRAGISAVGIGAVLAMIGWW